MRGSGLGIPHFDDMPYFFPMLPAGPLFYFLSIKLPPDFLCIASYQVVLFVGDIGEWSEATLTTQKR